MKQKVVRYSKLIQPITAVIDLTIIVVVLYFTKNPEYFNSIFVSYLLISWILISYATGYYKVYRYTHLTRLITLIFTHFMVYLLSFLSYFTLFKEGVLVNNQLKVFSLTFVIIVAIKFFIFLFLKKYRSTGNNVRNVVVFGHHTVAKKMNTLFKARPDLGYRFAGFFYEQSEVSSKYLGTYEDGFAFIVANAVNEIYCQASKFNQEKITKIRTFAKHHNIDFKIIPENKAIYSKNFNLEYYGTIPILKPKKLPFELLETHIIKRTFDILFSIIVCVLVLSWILPIIFIFQRLDSKGPFFFKQKRDGVNGKQFFCLKIRSMEDNSTSDIISASKNDKRVTRVGAFLRKSSLDELPQFLNVLKGDMSVVGPRPHMNLQTKKYVKEIDNYLIRNSVKPGITGLAQIRGFRGEVVKKADIENRVRMDIFYIENWSFLLDLKIIIQTFLNFFKKEEKAY